MPLIFGITVPKSFGNSCGDGELTWGAELRQKKELILGDIQALDHASDSVGLFAEEWLQRYALEASLMEIYKGDESFWRQRSR